VHPHVVWTPVRYTRDDLSVKVPRGRSVSPASLAGLLLVIAFVDIMTTRVLSAVLDPFFRAGVILGFVLWARRFAGLSWGELGCARDKVGSGFRWGLLATLVVGAVIVVGVAIPGTRSYFENGDVRNDSTLSHVLEPLVVIPFATVLFEEVIFRGVLLGALLRITTRVRAVIYCSIVFGLWHIPPALSDAKGKEFFAAVGIVGGTIAFTTAAGILFSWLRLRSGSLLAPIMAHVAANSFAYTGALIALDT
jgi:membrane protease YdiL (CAAX protease family)